MILTESLNDSPFTVEVVPSSSNPITCPPSRFIAASKLNLVRVEGSKNKLASTFPFNISGWPFASIFFDKSKMYDISAFVKSKIETMSLLFKLAITF